jgi:hypothetical protein
LVGRERLALRYRPRTPIDVSGFGLRSGLGSVPGACRIAVPHCGRWGGLVLSSQARFNLVGGCFPHPREIVSANDDVIAGDSGGLLHRLGELSGITGDIRNRLGRHHAGVRIAIFPRTRLSLVGRLRHGPIETGHRLPEMQRRLGGHGVREGVGLSRRTALALNRPWAAEERRDQSEKT